MTVNVWPATAERSPDGALSVGGCDVRDLAAEHGTPVYVMDERDLRTRARGFRDAYDGAGAGLVSYAAKALCATTVLRWVAEEGLGVDVATGGELAVALRAGIPVERITLHGNNKSQAEIDHAVGFGVGRIVIDSFDEIARVADAARRLGVVQSVLVRVTLGIEAHTHEFISTAHEDQKFGLSMASGDALEAVRRIVGLPSQRLHGLHSHIGSQIFDASGFEAAAARMVDLARTIADEGIDLAEFNLGGGMGIAYVDGDDPLDVDVLAHEIADIVGKQCAQAGLPMPSLAFEPGRAIAGPAGITLYEVGTVKQVALDGGEARTYVSVDGGMSDNIRTALYDAEYTVALASRSSSAPLVRSRVVGKHCESGDIVVRDALLPSDIVPGDLLAVAATGAYCRSMASNYNWIPRPPVIWVRDGASGTILRRETVEDLLGLDAGA